jgi:PAS domain S-box-containing protein
MVEENTLDPRLYNRLLLRLIGIPIASLALLALALGYGLQRVQQSAHAVDRADVVISRANNLIKLMVDEETGLRGYLLTRDPAFLQPMRDANRDFGPAFQALSGLISRPDQAGRLQRLNAEHEVWEQEAHREINLPPLDSATLEQHMVERRKEMDSLRAIVDEFLVVASGRRAEHSADSRVVNRYVLAGLILLAALVAALLVWETRRIFRELTAAYNRQIEEIHRRSEDVYAREQWLSTTLFSIGDAVIACDTEGRVDFMNLIAEQLTGWTKEEAKGVVLHEVFRIFNEETRTVVENPVDKVRRLGTIVGLANHTFLVSKDGREICIDDSGAPIRDSSGKMIGVVLVFRDITDRRVSEGALMRAEKLAAAGRLAASVAHEVNNPLEGLTNLVYIARHSEDLGEVRQMLMQAEGELGRIAHLTRQSLGFYRETSVPAYFKPAAIVREVAEFYQPRASSLGISVHIEASTSVEVLGSPGELRQIVSNLLANSLDACPRGASVRITASSASDPRNLSSPGIRITVADSGLGIPHANLKSIFEPFFTTKKDTGTGLGLWVSRELVEKHGGSMHVRSRTTKPRCGTIFSIFLPQRGNPQPADLIAGTDGIGPAHNGDAHSTSNWNAAN